MSKTRIRCTIINNRFAYDTGLGWTYWCGVDGYQWHIKPFFGIFDPLPIDWNNL